MTARELEAFLISQFGPDFRNKAIVGPFDSFRLADAFEECGLQDPSVPRSSVSDYGIFQFMPTEYKWQRQ